MAFGSTRTTHGKKEISHRLYNKFSLLVLHFFNGMLLYFPDLSQPTISLICPGAFVVPAGVGPLTVKARRCLRCGVWPRGDHPSQGGYGAGGAYSERYRMDKACARERSGGVKRAVIWSRNVAALALPGAAAMLNQGIMPPQNPVAHHPHAGISNRD